MAGNSSLIKVIILGDGGVGRSSLINRYVTNNFDIQLFKTIGVEFLNKIWMWINILVPLRFGAWQVRSDSEAWGHHFTDILSAACLLLVPMILKASRTLVTGKKNSYIMQMWKNTRASLLWFWVTRLTWDNSRCLQKKPKLVQGRRPLFLFWNKCKRCHKCGSSLWGCGLKGFCERGYVGSVDAHRHSESSSKAQD